MAYIYNIQIYCASSIKPYLFLDMMVKLIVTLYINEHVCL